MQSPSRLASSLFFAARGQSPSAFPLAQILGIACLLACALPQAVRGQLAPGPYEILPFDDACIIEAFRDMDLRDNYIADWTGYSYQTSGGWYLESPHPYDNHIGTDFSVQTGTALHAAAAGTVTGIQTGYARNVHDGSYGNFVRIAVDALSPNGELLDLTYCHMLSLSVSVNQHVNVGDLVGYSDNTGDSDSEHVHFMTEIRGVTNTCPFYWAHFKYPIMFNPTGTIQVGRVVKVTAASTPIRTDRFDTSAQITTAWQDQLYFSAYPKRGYYHVFIPNSPSYKAGFIRATDVEEVFTGTVIQPLPDNVVFTPLGQLATNKYAIRAAPDDGGSQLGQILFGGQRFVADQVSGGYYRIPVPGASATWGWVKPDNRMVVYPQLSNPDFNLSLLPNNDFPIRESFATVTNQCMFGRPKFNRPVVKAFSPISPGGDGSVLFVTDATNAGVGTSDSVTVGKPGYRNYYVQCDVYFNFRPDYLASDGGYERYGIFLRDDGFAGLDTTYEGAGNAYALLWDADDGRLRAAKLVDGAVTDFFPSATNFPASGWHTMRIEARETQIKYFLDGTLLVQINDSTFPAGTCGVGYSMHFKHYPPERGACFDNFVADTLDTNPPPIITTQPASQTVNAGQSVTLSVVATNPAPGTLTYQWSKDAASIPPGTDSDYTLSNVQMTDAAGYSVAVSNSGGTVTSATAYLSVVSPLTNPPGSILAPTGMIDWWPADGNALDIFGSYNGTPQPGFTYVAGEQGLAFHFDGSTGYLDIGAPSVAAPWTACMWVNRQATTNSSAALLADGTYSLKLEQYNGTHQVGVTQLGIGDYNFGYTAPMGAWIHLAFVGTGSQTLLYTNGVLQGTLSVNIPLPRAYVGAGYSTSSGKFIDHMLGSVDELLLFNRALSAGEINNIYSAGSAGLCRAPQFTGTTPMTGGQFGLNLKGQAGKNFTIYGSTNLMNWTLLGTVPNPSGSVQYFDSGATNAQKFYRSTQP